MRAKAKYRITQEEFPSQARSSSYSVGAATWGEAKRYARRAANAYGAACIFRADSSGTWRKGRAVLCMKGRRTRAAMRWR